MAVMLHDQGGHGGQILVQKLDHHFRTLLFGNPSVKAVNPRMSVNRMVTFWRDAGEADGLGVFERFRELLSDEQRDGAAEQVAALFGGRETVARWRRSGTASTATRVSANGRIQPARNRSCVAR